MSEMNKHTPRPWIVNGTNIFQYDHSGRVVAIASCSVIALPYKEHQANARLIAAAPDMLEALKNLENDAGTTMPASAWVLVQDSIRRAEGKPELVQDVIRKAEGGKE